MEICSQNIHTDSKASQFVFSTLPVAMLKLPKLGGRIAVKFEHGESFVAIIQAILPSDCNPCWCDLEVQYVADGEEETCAWPDPEITLLDYRSVERVIGDSVPLIQLERIDRSELAKIVAQTSSR